jgi:hypothetical protein
MMRRRVIVRIGFAILIAVIPLPIAVIAQLRTTAPSDRPGPSNTGPHGTLQPSGGIVARQDGQIISNVDITGTISIKAANVTIRNFRLNANDAPYAIRIFRDASVTLEDGEITHAAEAAVYGNDWTARRLNVHHMGSDGLKGGGNNRLEDCWIHHLGMTKGAHADGVQLDNGSHFVFRHNNFDLPWWDEQDKQIFRTNSVFFINGWVGNIDDVLIEDNWLNGGNYTIYALKQTGVHVRNNRMGRDFQFGLINGHVAELAGNRWDDNGKAAP